MKDCRGRMRRGSVGASAYAPRPPFTASNWHPLGHRRHGTCPSEKQNRVVLHAACSRAPRGGRRPAVGGRRSAVGGRRSAVGGRRSAGKRHANGTPATGAGRVATRDRMIEVNLIGPYLTRRNVVPHMVAKGLGRIVNIASVAGKEGNPNASRYSESTAGVTRLTQSPGNGRANNQAHSGVHAARSGRRQPRSRPATLDRRSLRNADEPLPRVPQQPAELRC